MPDDINRENKTEDILLKLEYENIKIKIIEIKKDIDSDKSLLNDIDK